jgi:hypothetical protein
MVRLGPSSEHLFFIPGPEIYFTNRTAKDIQDIPTKPTAVTFSNTPSNGRSSQFLTRKLERILPITVNQNTESRD